MLKDTADCENCTFKVKDGKRCPNYIECLWHKEGETQPTIIKDCAPKRTLLMIQELYNRTFALQKQINQSENQINELTGQFKLMLTAIHHIKDSEPKAIE